MDIGFRHMIPCSAVQGMGSGLLFCTDSHNKYVMPILNGTFLCFKMCAHVGTYFKVTTILHFFIRSKYITIFISYLLFFVMMMLFYLYICNYVTYIEGHKVE